MFPRLDSQQGYSEFVGSDPVLSLIDWKVFKNKRLKQFFAYLITVYLSFVVS